MDEIVALLESPLYNYLTFGLIIFIVGILGGLLIAIFTKSYERD